VECSVRLACSGVDPTLFNWADDNDRKRFLSKRQRVAAALQIDLLCKSLMLFVALSLAQVNVASPHECC
jgi:hypothetical protein